MSNQNNSGETVTEDTGDNATESGASHEPESAEGTTDDGNWDETPESLADEQPDGEMDRESIARVKARGLPAVWSAVLSAPFIVAGAFVYLRDPSAAVPASVGLPIAAFGLFIIDLGLYVHFVAAPEPPTLREGEEVIDTRNPAQRAALAKTVVGFVVLLGAGYLLFFTFRPYIYPTIIFIVGSYFFSTGLYTYWTNTLTTYYVTNQRLIKEYRFISVVRQELTFEKVRGVEERKSFWETLVGLGNVRVASGGGGTLEVVIRNIYSPTDFADEIRNLI